MKRIFWSELGHAPLFLGIHAMISSIPHKTQMYIEMTLWYVNFIFTHFLFPQFNEIFLLDFKVVKNCPMTQRSSNAYSTKKNVMLGITNIWNPESEEEVHEKKKHYGRSYQKFHFFSMPSWWHELTPTFNQQ